MNDRPIPSFRPDPPPPPRVGAAPVLSLAPSGSTTTPNLVDTARGVLAYGLSFGFLQSVEHFLNYIGFLRDYLPPKYSALATAVAAGILAFTASWLHSGYAPGDPDGPPIPKAGG